MKMGLFILAAVIAVVMLAPLVSAREILGGVVRDAFAPRARPRVDEWADASWVLVGETSAEAGRYSTDRTPYLRRILRLFGHPQVRRIAVMKASQLGGSVLCDIAKGYIVDVAPGPTLVMFSNIADARDYNQDRFLPAVDASPTLRRHLRESPQDTKNLKIRFDRMLMHFVGSNSASGRRSRPCQNVLCDEVGAYEDPAWPEVFDRVKTYGDHKILATSTPGLRSEAREDSPGTEETGIDTLYRQGSQEHYEVPCPHCGEYQELVFGQLKWDGRSAASPEHAKATARYECVHCGRACYDHHKPGMLARGVWVPDGSDAEAVIEAGHDAPGGRCDDPSPPESATFRISSLYSPFPAATWGHVAAEFVKAGMTFEFVTGWLGEPWEVTGDRLEVEELGRLCVPAAEGGYRLGEVPPWALSLVLAVDVQKRELFCGVFGFGEFARDVCLVDLAVIQRAEGANLTELDLWFPAGREWRYVGRADGLRVCVEAVDSGHFTDEAYAAVRRRAPAMGGNSHAVKGRDASRMMEPWHWAGKTQTIAMGCTLLGVNVDYWATSIVGRIKGRPDHDHDMGAGWEGEDPGGGGGGAPAPRQLFLPERDRGGLVAAYLEHMTSEAKTMVRGRGGRGVEFRWVKRPGGGPNHFLDLTRYALAVADARGARGLRRSVAPVTSGGVRSEGPREGGGWQGW